MTHTNICSGQHNKTINIIRFAHWEKSSLALRAKAFGFSRYCKRYSALSRQIISCSKG